MKKTWIRIALISLISAVLAPLNFSTGHAAPTWDKAIYFIDETTTPYEIKSLANQTSAAVAHPSWPNPDIEGIATDDSKIYYHAAAGIIEVDLSADTFRTLITAATLGAAIPKNDGNLMMVNNGWLYWIGSAGISRANLSTGTTQLNFLTNANVKSSFYPSGTIIMNKLTSYSSDTILLLTLDSGSGKEDAFKYQITNASNPNFSSSGGVLSRFLSISDDLNISSVYGVAADSNYVYFNNAVMRSVQKSDTSSAGIVSSSFDPFTFFANQLFISGNSLYFATGSQIGLWDLANPGATPNYILSTASASIYSFVAVTVSTPSSSANTPPPPPKQTSTVEKQQILMLPEAGGVISIRGSFPATVLRIWVDDVRLDPSQWSQTSSAIKLTLPSSKANAVKIRIINEQYPDLDPVVVIYLHEIAGPTPTPTPTPTPSENPVKEVDTPTSSAFMPISMKVYFGMSASNLSTAEKKRVENFAQRFASCTECKVSVTGFVQPTLKNPQIESLALARAKAAAKVLKSAGIALPIVTKSGGLAKGNSASSRYALIEVSPK